MVSKVLFLLLLLFFLNPDEGKFSGKKNLFSLTAQGAVHDGRDEVNCLGLVAVGHMESTIGKQGVMNV